MSLSDVSNILWRERQLLELLLFKLEEEQMILAGGRTRWLPHATREVETVLGELKR
ncbi:MAG TPA: flagellar protein FlgN, partial [Acidimicrobiia bacterium]|nr:flagellar protein FlgN [Acidimicrobiia bacterium]